jgi:hypothetical protein
MATNKNKSVFVFNLFTIIQRSNIPILHYSTVDLWRALCHTNLNFLILGKD